MRRLRLLALCLLTLSTASFAAEPLLGRAFAQEAGQGEEGPTQAGPRAAGKEKGTGEQTRPAAPARGSTEVFGGELFSGSFARSGPAQFNPDYVVATGDQIHVRLWGGYTLDKVLSVDPQGNIFLPQIGPVRIAGVRNQDMQSLVDSAVRNVFRNNVHSYTTLAAAQPVRIFVGGFVNRPGLYHGTSMDSLLHYLDQAGGIDAERGSFLSIQVKRGEQIRANINLYDFLLHGRIPIVQMADGDVVFVPARQSTVRVSGLAENARRFEFRGSTLPLADLITLARPNAEATHLRIVRNSGTVRNVDYFPLNETVAVSVENGDEVQFIADKKPGTITVRVEGEHLSSQEHVLPYGSRIGELLARIRFSERSDRKNIQLYRHSVRDWQKARLHTTIKSLETTVLTARSGTSDEARLRKDEADLLLRWVERARDIEPAGQVLIAQTSNRDELLLENGDVIKVPALDGLVLVSGEVLFPNAIAHDGKLRLDDYIQLAGGYTQNADNSRIIIVHRDGSYAYGTQDYLLQAGDEILVLPKVDVKSRQIWKDMTQILFNIAVSAKVVLGL